MLGELHIMGPGTLGPSATTGKVLKIVPLAAPSLEVTGIQATGSKIGIDFRSPRPVSEHRAEAHADLESAGWSEVASSLVDLGHGEFLATSTPSAGSQEFCRVVVADGL